MIDIYTAIVGMHEGMPVSEILMMTYMGAEEVEEAITHELVKDGKKVTTNDTDRMVNACERAKRTDEQQCYRLLDGRGSVYAIIRYVRTVEG